MKPSNFYNLIGLVWAIASVIASFQEKLELGALYMIITLLWWVLAEISEIRNV